MARKGTNGAAAPVVLSAAQVAKPATTQGPVTVRALHAEHFCVLDEVDVAFGSEGVEFITGDNGDGKTTLAWAIVTTIDPSLAPDQPIKNGEKTSNLVVSFGDPVADTVEFTVTTRWWRNRNTNALEVAQELTWPNGATQTSRVAEWVRQRLGITKGEGRFDPAEMTKLSRTVPGRREQAATLRRMVKLDTSDLVAVKAEAEAARSRLRVEALTAEAAAVIVPEALLDVGEEWPVVDVLDVASIAERKVEVERARTANAAKRAEATRLRGEALAQGRTNETLRQRVKAAEEALRLAQDAIGQGERDLDKLDGNAEAAERAAAALVDPSTAEIDDAMAEARETNRRARAEAEEHNRIVRATKQLQADRARLLADKERRDDAAQAERKRWDELTAVMRKADADALARLKDCTFPVPGLGIDGDEVTFDDGVNGAVPLAQASEAQRARVWMAVYHALHPNLRFIHLEGYKILGDAAREAVEQYAREHHLLVLAEYPLAKGDMVPEGLLIQSGSITEDRRPGRKAKPAEVAEVPPVDAPPPGDEVAQAVPPTTTAIVIEAPAAVAEVEAAESIAADSLLLPPPVAIDEQAEFEF